MHGGLSVVFGALGSLIIIFQRISVAEMLAGVPLGMWTLLALSGLYALGAYLYEGLLSLWKKTSTMRKNN